MINKEKVELEKLMKTLNISEDEAKEVMAYDYAVEHNEKTEYDITPEQKKIVKKMTNCDHKKNAPTAYKFQKKERKKNDTKAELVAAMAEFLTDKVENLSIVNAEGQLFFSYNGNDYDLKLIQKRKAKGV